jgi:hypothetical protein
MDVHVPHDIGSQMILAEWLFVETVSDLRQRCRNPRERGRYQLLGIASLIRKLLVDAHPLVHTVRDVRREVPLQFRIVPWAVPESKEADSIPSLDYYLRLGGMEMVDGPKDAALPLRAFLRASVGQADGEPLTVRDVVLYYSHVEGGVHFGTANDPTQRVLSSMAPLLLGHTTGQIQILAHIGAIVVDALIPLCDAILSAPTRDVRIHLLSEEGRLLNHWTSEARCEG